MINSRRWKEFLKWWRYIEINGLSASELADMIDEKIMDINDS